MLKQLGPALVSATFLGVYLAHYLGYGIPWGDGDVRLNDICLGIVLTYWIGSSSESVRKTDILSGGAKGGQ